MGKKLVKKKIKLTTDQRRQRKIQNDHRAAIRSIFRQTGFHQVENVADKEFIFQNQKGDFDDIFVFENIIILAEYTVTQASGLGIHLKNKKLLFDKILSARSQFVAFLKERFPNILLSLSQSYHHNDIELRIIYCPLFDLELHHKENIQGPCYFDYPLVRYFHHISSAIKMSARFELFDFLRIEDSTVGEDGSISISKDAKSYVGFILPESRSNFFDGYKVVSFYVDPRAMLRRAYVLRRDGWRASPNLYQRMVSTKKIEAIRKYLRLKKRVFVNNMIVTLPSDTKLEDHEKDTVATDFYTKTSTVSIQIPDRHNCVGVIDGQHRLYSYYEAVKDDAEIAVLRKQQNLLMTGIIYPKEASPYEREKFEANLFLEINSTQTNANSKLKQAIGLVLDPFNTESIATRVVNGLATGGGALGGRIELYFFDQNKLKTTSIVSYGLKPLVKTNGQDSLFAIWEHPDKEKLIIEKLDLALEAYIKFSVSQINHFISAFKANVPIESWTTDKKISGRLLTTTTVNSLLICLRLLIESKKTGSFEYYRDKMHGISSFPFNEYHSSQYNRMAREIFTIYFDT